MLYAVLFVMGLMIAGASSVPPTPRIEDVKYTQVDEIVKEGGRVVVVYGADWCPACVRVNDLIPEVTKNKKVTVLKVDTDTNPTPPEVKYIPYFEVFVGGKKIFSGNVESQQQFMDLFQ